MNKKISLGAAIAFALIVAAAVFSITMVHAQETINKDLSGLQERQQLFGKFSEITAEVQQRYYGEIDDKELQDSIAEGYLKGIGDPQATYYDVEAYSQLKKDEDSDHTGIGVQVKPSSDGFLTITDVYPDSPAYRVDVKSGSTIIDINGHALTESNNENLMGDLYGPDGEAVTLTVRTDGNDQFYDLICRIYIVPTVTWHMIENTDIAYIRLHAFDMNSSNQFNRTLKELQEQGAKSLIFDLRGTETSELSSSTRILDRIVPKGAIVSAVDRDNNVEILETSDSNELNMPMAVIVNSKTSGAAEIFAQVLMDYEKAKSVGTPTAGKGVQMETVPLSDGSAIKLTVALYRSPSGKSFDGEGVQPDFEVQLTGVEDSQWEVLTLEKDTQLSKAIEVVTVS